jgi:hypothetical protein
MTADEVLPEKKSEIAPHVLPDIPKRTEAANPAVHIATEIC